MRNNVLKYLYKKNDVCLNGFEPFTDNSKFGILFFRFEINISV